MYEGYQTLKVVRDGPILTVSFNRPDVLNAASTEMHQEIARVFPQIGRDPEVRVAILTGEGAAFSAGGDVMSMRENLDNHGAWIAGMKEARDVLMGVIDIDTPVIAKINGDAMGLAASLALTCDISIASETARIADPHVKVGLTAGDGGSIIWPELIGYARAKKYLLTGRPITGAEAAEIGLVTEAVPADQLDQRVNELARELARGAGMAIRLTKRAVNMSLKQKIESLLEAHLGFETMTHLSQDHREALAAFVERRKPIFTGD